MKPLSLPICTILLLALLVLGCAPRGLSAAAAAPTPRPIRIGVNTGLPPFGQTASSGSPAGFEVDLVRTIARQTGLTVELVPAEYNQLIEFVGGCKLDGSIAAITITTELRQTMLFSESYYSTGQVVVVKDGNLAVQATDGLAGMRVGTQVNTPSEAELKKIAGVDIRPYKTFYPAFQDLIGGYIDAVVTDYPRAASFAKTQRNHLKIVGAPFGRADYGIAFCKDRPELVEQFNTGIQALKDSGLLDRLVKKWAIQASLPLP